MQNSQANKSTGDVKKIIVITLKLLVIGVVSAMLLAVVNGLTKDKIAENTAKEKNDAINAIFPGNFDIKPIETEVKGVNEINTVNNGNLYLGYVAEVAPKGFGGEITLMVGVNKDGRVVGVKVISHSETAGLGSRICEVDYLKNYVGVTGESIFGVDTISGATISSTAVREGVATALSAYESVNNAGGAQ